MDIQPRFSQQVSEVYWLCDVNQGRRLRETQLARRYPLSGPRRNKREWWEPVNGQITRAESHRRFQEGIAAISSHLYPISETWRA